MLGIESRGFYSIPRRLTLFVRFAIFFLGRGDELQCFDWSLLMLDSSTAKIPSDELVQGWIMVARAVFFGVDGLVCHRKYRSI